MTPERTRPGPKIALREEYTRRFWSRVAVGGQNECWSWLRGLAGGYGVMHYCGRVILAHRIAWMIANGNDPGAAMVCHHCDNKVCVNPSHLFLGDARANAIDLASKGLHYLQKHPERSRFSGGRSSGENNPQAKLTRSQVDELRSLPQSASQASVAKSYGISASTVSLIRNGKRWR